MSNPTVNYSYFHDFITTKYIKHTATSIIFLEKPATKGTFDFNSPKKGPQNPGGPDFTCLFILSWADAPIAALSLLISITTEEGRREEEVRSKEMEEREEKASTELAQP